MPQHPSPDELSDFLLGKLPPENSEKLAEHLEVCPPCQNTVNQLESQSDTFLEQLRKAPEPAPVDPACEQAVKQAMTMVKGAADAVSVTQDFSAQPANTPSAAPGVSSPALAAAGDRKGPSKDDFAKLIRDANLFSDEQLAALDAELAAASDTQDLARRLVKKGSLTKFQAQLIYQGKTRHLAFGEYLVLDRIGEGGMGQVFKARHRRMDRLVAIKVMNNAAMKEPEAVKRFQREVKAAAKLNHPNIVTAYDAGENAGVHFLVMEFVEGHDLSGHVKDHGPLAVAEAMHAILQAARGLAFAHAEGVVHRDIKPANLLRDKKGVVRILDMGLARFEEPLGKGKDDGLTNSGQVMGTIDYMAPEQAFNTRDAGPAADVYSLGCTLYRLLTAQPLFDGETVVQKLFAHRENPIPSLSASVANVPAALETLFQRMVAKEVANRPTMAEIVEHLETLTKPQPAAAPVGWTPRPSSSSLSSSLSSLPNEPDGRGVHPTPRPKSSGVGRKLPPLKWIAAGFAACVLLLAGIIILRPSGGDGEFHVEVENDAVAVALNDAGGITLIDRATKKEFRIAARKSLKMPAGDYDLVVTNADGFEFSAKEFTLKSKESDTVRVSFKPNAVTQVGSVPQTVPSKSDSRVRNNFALSFHDGASVELPSLNTALDLVGPMTIECWVMALKTAEPRGDVPVVGVSRHDFGLYLNGLDNWQFRGFWAKQPADGQWYAGGGANAHGDHQNPQRRHMAYVRTPKQFLVFKDGVLTGTSDTPPQAALMLAPQPPITIGGAGISGHFHGLVDEVRFSKVARYEKDFTPQQRFEPDADTTALYHFEEGTGDVLHDSSGNNHHGKIIGAKWVKADGTAIPPLLASGPVPPPAIAPFNAQQARAHQEAWAKHLGTMVETTNSVGAKMILIPPGEFLMGSSDEQVEAALKVAEEIKADSNVKGRIQMAERPQHKVVITKPFLLSATEVTIGQFKKFSATGYVTEAEKAAPPPPVAAPKPILTYRNPGYAVTDDSPAAAITWHDAVAYCKWLSDQEKRTYRLPTEAEWEYACRAGTTTQYSFGDEYTDLRKYGWHNKNAGSTSHPVGTLLPNGFGLFDMHGNLQEWCGDLYDEKGYAASTPNDPIATVGSNRVIRGGYWHSYASYCRSASRLNPPPSNHSHDNGFRVVRVLDIPAPTATKVDPDRKAAEWVLSVGGHGVVITDLKVGTSSPFNSAAPLPSTPFVLQHANLTGKPIRDEDLARFSQCQRLDTLNLTGCPINGSGLKHLEPIRTLVELHLNGVGNGKEQSDDLLAPLAKMPQLKWLSLTYCESLTDASLKHLSSLTNLEHLQLNSVLKLTDQGLESLSPLRRLKSLGLSCGDGVTDIGLRAMISRNPDLENLWVVNDATHRTLAPLREAVRLKEVYLSGEQLTPEGLAALQQLPLLETVWISSPCTNEAVSRLVELPRLKTILVFFNIAGATPPDAGYTNLAKHPGVENLTLQGACGSPTDVLLLEFSKLLKLKTLNVNFGDQFEKRRYTTDWIAKFRERRPDVTLQVDGVNHSATAAAIDFDAERQAADWVLSVGGHGDVITDLNTGVDIPFGPTKSLPATPFVLRRVNLTGKQIRDEDLARFSHCTRLTDLSLIGCPINGSGLKHLEPIRTLVYLNLTSVGSRIELSDEDLAPLAKMPQLKHLYLNSNTLLTDAALRHLSGLVNLEHLDLTDVSKLTDQGLDSLARLQKLTKLFLSSERGPTDIGVRAMVTRNPNLEWIGLDTRGRVGQRTLLPLREAKRLKRIDLSGDQLTPEGVAVLQQLPLLDSVWVLLPYSDEEVARLVELPKLKSIKFFITTAGTTSPDAGYTALAKHPGVETLSLDGASGSPTDAVLLEFSKLPKLKTLEVKFGEDFEKRRYTTDWIAKFRELRPDVKLNVDGTVYPTTTAK